MRLRGIYLSLLFVVVGGCSAIASTKPWPVKKSNQWYSQQAWPLGSNFIPSTAENELEMWQADTFDLPTIDRELGFAESLGMNSMRVFLHNIPWQEDSKGFLDRIDQFLQVADKHHIRIIFVLLDSCWDPHPKPGKQPPPIPHVHNSRWVQAPGADILKDPSSWGQLLKPYIVGVIGHFANDHRVLMWDLMNEPDNGNPSNKGELPNKSEMALKLLKREWQWARAAKPSQPLTSGVWQGKDWSSDEKLSDMTRFQLENSDVITFHNYDPPEEMQRRIDSLRRYHRPLICTEYMARPLGSTFFSILPLLKKENVGAFNWGFVSGKSQTIYPWDSWKKQYGDEPPVWFHDIFRKNGDPYDPKETQLIRQLAPPRTAQ